MSEAAPVRWADGARRVLLVCPPWQMPLAPSLAIATLGPLLRQAGIACDELHASTLWPVTLSNRTFLERLSGYFFAPLLNPAADQDRLVRRMVEICRTDSNFGGLLYPEEEATLERLGLDATLLRWEIRQGFRCAQICLERCLERADRDEYDVIGLSVTFEAQLPAALALAERLKQRRPEVRIMLGGAACAQEQGEGLLRSFPVLDAVCCTEGETVIVPLVRALRGQGPLEEVPGIAYRTAQGQVHRTPSPPLLQDLDQLPVPDFQAFFEQYERSEWGPRARPYLVFETSRGCWWGQKHLCTFCGLNAEGLPYRRKSPARALAEIRTLYQRYPSSGYLEATDNILDLSYLREVMPQLARMPQDPRRPLQLFFEVKTSLRREQVHALARAGVTDVQPGIESFSDGVLALMDKGATGAGQVQFLKWAYEAGIEPVYNLIVRNPGEQAAWYREMTELVSAIEHLPPPAGMTPMLLERFSPYHSRPESHGITNVRPRDHYRDLFPGLAVDLPRVAYIFDFDHPMQQDEELLQAHRALARRVLAWQQSWRDRQSFYIDRGAYIDVHDRRGGRERLERVGGVATALFRYLDRARPEAVLGRKFQDLDPVLLECLLRVWERRRWLCRLSGRLLGVLPARPARDRGGRARRWTAG